MALSTTPSLEPDVYLTHLGRDGPALADAAAAHLASQVPGCPDWDVAALVGHMSMIHRWVTRILETRAQEAPSRRDIGPPPDGPAVLDWYRQGLTGVTSALEATDPDHQIWNFTTGVSPSRFWFRRMAQETAVHRWDAQSAMGDTLPIDPVLAVDGIVEMLGSFIPMRGSDRDAPDQLRGSLHIHATDIDGEWTVRQVDGRFEVEERHTKGDAALRGSASDLLLTLWGRPTLDRLEQFGDAGVVERWRKIVRF